jgi:hypothetical protein
LHSGFSLYFKAQLDESEGRKEGVYTSSEELKAPYTSSEELKAPYTVVRS